MDMYIGYCIEPVIRNYDDKSSYKLQFHYAHLFLLLSTPHAWMIFDIFEP